MANRGYKPGRHRVQCDRCGASYLDDKVVTEWTGAVVCRGPGTRNCWEPRHSQDMVRARADDSSVDNARPRTIQYISDVYPNGVTADDL